MSFFYSFTETILHSLWQSALCALLYFGAKGMLKKAHPLQKRNFLFGLLGAQFIISIATFIFYYTGSTAPVQTFYSNSIIGSLFKYADIIFFAYAAALTFHAARLSTRWGTFKMHYREGITRPSPELKVFTELKAYHLGIKRKVSLWYSAHVDTPLTFGMLKPVILLPLSLLNHISMQETEAIILHELAHIKSRDYLLNRLLIVAEMIYFFNPFIRMIAKEIRLEREKNCDVQVINFDYPGLLYAEALLKTARNSHSIKTFQLGAVTGKAQLLKRIQFFTEGSNLVFNKRRTGFLSSVLIPFFILTALFFLPGTRRSKQQKPVAANTTLPYSLGENSIAVNYNGIGRDEKTPAVQTASVTVTSNEGLSSPVEETDGEDMMPALQAAFTEIPDSVKEFIYKVETPQGVMTQSFRMTLVKGQWVMQPQWMVLETPPDSLGKCPADTVFRVSELPQ